MGILEFLQTRILLFYLRFWGLGVFLGNSRILEFLQSRISKYNNTPKKT